MSGTLALTGWAAALLVVLSANRTLSLRMDALMHACHELRGPLTAAQLGLELEGRRGTLPPPRLRALELELGRAALALEDLAAVETARPRVRTPACGRELVDVAGLLADSVEAWRPAAERHGVELNVAWSGPPASVPGRRLRLAQATGNLIANAIEHGRGPVEVRGCGVGGIVRVEVLDHGPGLNTPLEQLVRRRRRSGRRGRGLAIVSQVAAAHGGRLSAGHSERGARLVLELPVPVSRD